MRKSTVNTFLRLRLGGILLVVSISGCEKTNIGADDALETSRYEIKQVTNPNRKGSLLDLQHHFHIDVTNAKVPITVKLPIQLKHLRDADVDSLSLVYHVPKKGEYEMIGQLDTTGSAGAMVDVIKTGNYSVIGLPADALSRSMIKAYCGQRKIPRICTEIDCRRPGSNSVTYVPGVPPCELCTRMQQDVQFAECLLDFPDIRFPPRIVSRNGGNGSDESPCEFRVAVFDGCIFFNDVTEQQCLEIGPEASGIFRAGDLTEQPCECGTSEQSVVFDPPPNGCFGGPQTSCIGRTFNCEAVSE